jgi:hypothetical protein
VAAGSLDMPLNIYLERISKLLIALQPLELEKNNTGLEFYEILKIPQSSNFADEHN